MLAGLAFQIKPPKLSFQFEAFFTSTLAPGSGSMTTTRMKSYQFGLIRLLIAATKIAGGRRGWFVACCWHSWRVNLCWRHCCVHGMNLSHNERCQPRQTYSHARSIYMKFWYMKSDLIKPNKFEQEQAHIILDIDFRWNRHKPTPRSYLCSRMSNHRRPCVMVSAINWSETLYSLQKSTKYLVL